MNHQTIEVSVCCKATPLETFRDNPRDHHDPIPTYTCEKCGEECDVEDVCSICGGTGEVSVMEPVYAGEPHMADIGVRTCLCKIEE